MHYYTITFYDGTTDTLEIPVSSGQLKKKIVSVIPNAATADDSTFYLVPDPAKVGNYSQYIRVENGSGGFEMLFIGTTEVDLSEYVPRITTELNKSTYKNYDTNTNTTTPTTNTVIGAINEHELVIGTGNYDYTNGKIPSLKTYHNDTLINAINEIGDISKLEIWNSTTKKPDNLVDAINFANSDYEVVENTTIDRTKFVDTYKLTKDAEDGTAETQMGDTVEVPRVDVVKKATADTGDYRTYDVKVGGELSDPNDTSNTAYGSIHIPKIRLVKDTNPADTTMASQYWLEIEGNSTYDSDRCGVKIDIAKDSFMKDIKIQTVTTADTPYTGALVGEKYLEFIFTLSDGTDKSLYVPMKDLMTPFEGKEAITVDDTTSTTTSYIKLVIYDPDNIKAITQDANGLTIAKATTTQYGVLEFATQTEVLSASASPKKAVTPYDLYDFVNNSTSVKGDLGSFYKEDDGTGTTAIVNNTVIKALNELSTEKIEKAATVANADNISEYQLETLPKTGVKNALGDLIEIPKGLVYVDKLSTITTPLAYRFYYLKTQETISTKIYDSGIYVYNDPNWELISGTSAIIKVNSLPTTNIKENSFYELVDTDVVVKRYDLMQSAIDDGIYANENGVHDGTLDISWASVLTDWVSYLDIKIEEKTDGNIYLIQHSDGTQSFVYNYESTDGNLYYYYNTEWHAVNATEKITKVYIDALKYVG